MWLLSTDRAELHHFPSPESVTGGYAILSHTWSSNEQTFQETQALHEKCKRTGQNPRDLAHDKVRECCILAERHGYRWVWDDTCCIDKTSSTELSEAINSMFLWYSRAEVCFAYLAEVESSCQLDAPMSAFRTARWHSRGWTLQELIAPTVVIFVSRDWQTIGNKVELASLLQEVTGVFSRVLTREVHCSTVSVAERMLWASNRSTTRVEDEAYCLMGLFNVNMPTIYGEGQQAFRRLQQEIMKQSFDTSLFAWGAFTRLRVVTPVMPQEIYRFLNTSSHHHVYLLADSPKRFLKSWGRTIRYTPSANNPLQPYLEHQEVANLHKLDGTGAPTRLQSGPFGSMDLPMFSATNYGINCRFPIIESDGLTVAVLLCDNSHEHIGLFLHPSPDTLQAPSRKRYNTGHGFRNASNYVGFARLVSLGNDFHNLRLRGKPVTAQWRDVFISDSPPATKTDVTSTLCSRLHSIAPAPPFRLPHWLIGRLALMGMELQSLNVEHAPTDGVPFRASATFEDVNADEGLCLILGTCTQSPSGPAHWARAIIPQCFASSRTPESHDCREHHVGAWPGGAKDFGDAERTVRLSFSRCMLTPVHTLVVHIEVEGRLYTALKERKNVVLPARPSPEWRTGEEFC